MEYLCGSVSALLIQKRLSTSGSPHPGKLEMQGGGPIVHSYPIYFPHWFFSLVSINANNNSNILITLSLTLKAIYI